MGLEFHSKIAMITQNSLVVQTYALLLEFLQPVMHRTYVTLGRGGRYSDTMSD